MGSVWGRAAGAVVIACALFGCASSPDRPARARLATALDSPTSTPKNAEESANQEGIVASPVGSRAPATPPERQPLVDCRWEKNATRPTCRPARDVPAGMLGGGFSLAAIDSEARYGGGFVDAKQLYVAASSDTEGYGLVLAVDLVRGDRRIVAGAYGRGRGRRVVGKGPDLDGVRDVARAADGTLYAFAAQPRERPNALRVFAIDPRTGERAIVWEWKRAKRAFDCDGGPEMEVDPASFATDDSGSVYFATRDREGDIGLVALKPKTGCVVVSRSGRSPVGAGPALSGGLVLPRASNGKIWALDALGLVAIDPKDGGRTRVSSAATVPSIGEGDDFGSTSLAVGKRRAWTAGGASYPAVRITLVDLETGDRHAFRGIKGPLADPGLGTSIWQYPESGVVVVSVGGGFAFFDPKTNVSNLFSR